LSYVVGYVFFINIRLAADETPFPVHYAYPIELETFVFAGILPTGVLQDARTVVLDWLMVAIYLTHFLGIHLIALVTMRTRQDLFPRVVGALIVMYTIALAVHYVLPTAPPWLASEAGFTEHQVTRIAAEITASLAGTSYEAASFVDGNLVAAMPSLHAGFATLVALILSKYGQGWCRVGIAYVVAMCFALTYLGEHYVVDELVGIVLAIGAWRLTFVKPFQRSRVSRAVQTGLQHASLR
jgi:membrane-associated phospholipid phosphatase